MAQGGDPTGTGAGGSTKPDLRAEFSNAAARARRLLDGADQQPALGQQPVLHLLGRRAPFLDGQYTVWGEVTEGMDHVDALPKGEPPREPGKILTARVAADAA